MKQVLIKKGNIIVDQIPAPVVSDNGVLVKVHYSCISAGTEMTGVSESGKSLVKKAIEQPEKIKKAINIAKSQGVDKLFGKVKELEFPQPTGYSASGEVIAVGKNVLDLKVGDRVACAGAGIANHASCIQVPRNLVMKIPNDLDLKLASTVTLGGIALQGVRRADIRLGEFVVVFGMGILGQITAQLLIASGCRVIAVDIDNRKLSLAKELGCKYVINSINSDVVNEINDITEGFGVDVAIITAATNSNELLSQAFNTCRKKGKVVLVGVVGSEFNRSDMYEKELDFLISTSYGPGRYDPLYEEVGIDYPYGYVRWTENRNMEEYLKLLSENKIDLNKLIDAVYHIDEAVAAYDSFKNPDYKPLIVLLEYDKNQEPAERRIELQQTENRKTGRLNVALIGAGEFAKAFHLPNLQKLDHLFNIYAVTSRTGLNAKIIGEQFGAKIITTDYQEIINDPNVDVVMISTRHNLHAEMAIQAMQKGKYVFVEKPLALNPQQLEEILSIAKNVKLPLMVGFNRRFSKYAKEIKRHINDRKNPLIINYQMNAGPIPLNHWVHGEEGGGRVIGEACHIIDLFNYFTDANIVSISVNSINPVTKDTTYSDNVVTTLSYSDGSVCTLTYTSLGNNKYPKETCSIFYDNKVITLEDYKKLTGHGVKIEPINTKVPEKGQLEELVAFYESIQGNYYPIELWDLEQTTRATFIINEELKQ